MKGVYGPYFILMIHIITLTFRLHLIHIIDNVIKIDLPIKEANNILNNFFKTNFIYDTGKIDLITMLNFILFFLIGSKFNSNFIFLLFSIISLEFVLVYYNNNPQIIINTISSILGYFIGQFINNFNKNKRHEIRYNNSDDLLYEVTS